MDQKTIKCIYCGNHASNIGTVIDSFDETARFDVFRCSLCRVNFHKPIKPVSSDFYKKPKHK